MTLLTLSVQRGGFHCSHAVVLASSYASCVYRRTSTLDCFPSLTPTSPPVQFSDGAFAGVNAIKSLHLDNNKLKWLPRGFDFGTINNLTLSNNPWSCTCQLAPLRR